MEKVKTGWRTIESAPRDGTRVDLWDRSGHRWTDAHWGVHYWRHGMPAGEPSWGRGTIDGPAPDPTHWMPLPAPPE
jgi:hypothetical protein